MQRLSSFWSDLYKKGGENPPRIGFSDSYDPRVLKAVEQLTSNQVIHPVLVGDPAKIQTSCKQFKINSFNAPHLRFISESDRHRYADLLLERLKKYNLSVDDVKKRLEDPLYQGLALLANRELDGLIAGADRPTGEVVKAALQCIGPGANYKLISGQFLVESELLRSTDGTPFLFADCAVMPEPSSRSLAAIAISAAASYRFFTRKDPKIVLLSFSTRGSASHELVDRIREALMIVKKQDPSLLIDGEMQADAALDSEVALIKKANDSAVSGRANVFIFPTLEAGNISYKLVQRFSGARVAGPFLWGLQRPMSDLSRGCTVQEVTDTALCVSAMARGLN